jgi:hypothetical protein
MEEDSRQEAAAAGTGGRPRSDRTGPSDGSDPCRLSARGQSAVRPIDHAIHLTAGIPSVPDTGCHVRVDRLGRAVHPAPSGALENSHVAQARGSGESPTPPEPQRAIERAASPRSHSGRTRTEQHRRQEAAAAGTGGRPRSDRTDRSDGSDPCRLSARRTPTSSGRLATGGETSRVKAPRLLSVSRVRT